MSCVGGRIVAYEYGNEAAAARFERRVWTAGDDLTAPISSPRIRRHVEARPPPERLSGDRLHSRPVAGRPDRLGRAPCRQGRPGRRSCAHHRRRHYRRCLPHRVGGIARRPLRMARQDFPRRLSARRRAIDPGGCRGIVAAARGKRHRLDRRAALSDCAPLGRSAHKTARVVAAVPPDFVRAAAAFRCHARAERARPACSRRAAARTAAAFERALCTAPAEIRGAGPRRVCRSAVGRLFPPRRSPPSARCCASCSWPRLRCGCRVP